MWHFNSFQEGHTIQEPIQGEFFADEAISEPGIALIREGIQNSLDAAQGGPALVRIRITEGPPMEDLLQGCRNHFEADGSGIRKDDIPADTENCRFLVLEDFQTTGLEGDPLQAFKPRGDKQNNFYHFFRSEGQTDKHGSDLGSWGVGKQVFPRSSRLNVYFGLTVRKSDNQALLMGRSILRHHYNANEQYCRDGYFGVKSVGSNLVQPIEDKSQITEFKERFDLQREATDPGLSIIIPWLYSEIDDRALVQAVLQNYFWPIMSGRLTVMIEAAEVEALLNASSLDEEISRLGDAIDDGHLELVQLAQWAQGLKDEDFFKLNPVDKTRAWNWEEGLFKIEEIQAIQKLYINSKPIAIRIPVTVRKKDVVSQESYFDVFIQKREDGEVLSRPVFIREGVVISSVRGKRTQDTVGLVFAQHPPIASFLRDAENPSHTDWQHDGFNFKGKYKSGKSDLEFVKAAVQQITRKLGSMDQEEDSRLLSDLFPRIEHIDQEGRKRRKSGKEAGDDDIGRLPIPPPRQKAYRINKVAGGFSICGTDNGARIPKKLKVQVAYDIRRGNPLKKYMAADFRMESRAIKFDPPPKGVTVVTKTGNLLLVDIEASDFSLHVCGFDSRRDLFLKVDSEVDSDGN